MSGPRLVILESPYAGDVEANLTYARACLRHSLLLGEAPIASHLLYTQPGVLDDNVHAERCLGIDAGLAWGLVAQATVVYGDRGISDGMRQGIFRAGREKRPVEFRRIYLPGQNRPPEPDEVLLAWHCAQITEGQAAQMLNMSRIQARIAYDGWAAKHDIDQQRLIYERDPALPARHAPAQVVQAQTLAHPEPDLFHARLKDIEDLGFDLLPNSLGLAAMKSREALVALIQRLLLQNDQALAAGKVYPNASAVSALSTILRDLLDDLREEPDADR